jgi:hypothetical protein
MQPRPCLATSNTASNQVISVRRNTATEPAKSDSAMVQFSTFKLMSQSFAPVTQETPWKYK